MANTDVKALNALNTRVWYVEGGVHPLRSPQLLALGKISTDPAQSIGEAKKITAPDPDNFDRDIQVGETLGETARATLSVGTRYTPQKSVLIGWKNRQCRVDIYGLSGKCGNPQDFDDGGEKWVYFPDGRVSSHGYENFGAYGRDENNPTNEAVDMTSEEYYEFLYERADVIGSSVTSRQIQAIDTYPGDNCENCPDATARVLMAMAGASATPGTQPSILYSQDAGETWASQTISTLFSNEDVADGAVIGGDIVYISNTSREFHWTDVIQLFEGSNVWNQTGVGFVVNKGPRAMSSSDVRHTWVVGDGGYIYFANNHKLGVTVQDAGIATTQNLLAVHALDSQHALAVGNSNAVVYTRNGGITWEAVTGPSVGVNMGACWMWDTDTWLVGEGAGGNGKLWCTNDNGKTWSEIRLPSAYTRIYKIAFVSEAEGYLSAQSGGQSYILRTITGGNSWVVLPQGHRGTPPANAFLTDIAVTSQYFNTAYAAGLASGGTLGVALKFSA